MTFKNNSNSNDMGSSGALFPNDDTCSGNHGFSAMLGRRRPPRPQYNPYVVGDVNRPGAHRLRVVHISDTLDRHDKILPTIPDGDILVHSGNFVHCRLSRKLKCQRNLSDQLDALNAFFGKLPHRYKIFVAGNHEMAFEQASALEIQSRLKAGIIYLQDNNCIIDGLKFWGVAVEFCSKRYSSTSFFKGFVRDAAEYLGDNSTRNASAREPHATIAA